jgi:hypothetical protein
MSYFHHSGFVFVLVIRHSCSVIGLLTAPLGCALKVGNVVKHDLHERAFDLS